MIEYIVMVGRIKYAAYTDRKAAELHARRLRISGLTAEVKRVHHTVHPQKWKAAKYYA